MLFWFVFYLNNCFLFYLLIFYQIRNLENRFDAGVGHGQTIICAGDEQNNSCRMIETLVSTSPFSHVSKYFNSTTTMFFSEAAVDDWLQRCKTFQTPRERYPKILKKYDHEIDSNGSAGSTGPINKIFCITFVQKFRNIEDVRCPF